ncbi:MAG: hypothetical protein AAF705_19285 [Bacteroidota bacterium]
MSKKFYTTCFFPGGIFLLALGLLTSMTLSGQTSIDFTNPATSTFGTNAQYNYNGTMMMWAGDANSDGQILYLGGTESDIGVLSLAVFTNANNTAFESDFPLSGVYHAGDLNLDGQVDYLSGVNGDIGLISLAVFLNPLNTQFESDFPVLEQIPTN